MDASEIAKIFTTIGVSHSLVQPWSDEYSKHLDKFNINTKYRIAAFFANVMLESAKLSRLEENLNYSAERLAQVFPSSCSLEGYKSRTHTPNQKAKSISHNPRMIGAFIYANRLGNGNESTHEGYMYRGRGPIQITGKTNYRKLDAATNLGCLDRPDILLTIPGGVISSCWYFQTANCSQYADRNDFDGVRDIVNKGRKTSAIGDALGYKEALSYYKQILSVI